MGYTFDKMQSKISVTYRTLENQAKNTGNWKRPDIMPNNFVSITNIVDKIIENVPKPCTEREIASEIIYKMIHEKHFSNKNLLMSIVIGFFYLSMELTSVKKPIKNNISEQSTLGDIKKIVLTW
jgi:hypothetical protein